MKTYRCWLDTGTAILVDAYTEDEARRAAELDTGLSVIKIECLSD